MRPLLLLFLALCSACADVGPLGSVHPVAPAEPVLYTGDIEPDTGGSTPTDPANPGSQWPVRITSTHIAGGMPYVYPGEIEVAGFMTYDSHHAEINLNVNIAGPDAITRQLGPVPKNTNTFFGNAHSAAFRHYVRSGCGNTVFLDFKFRAWFSFPGYTLDEKHAGESRTFVQGNCPLAGGGGGPPDADGGGGGGTLRCYTLVTHHYDYDPITGEARYLYSTEEELGCEQVA